MDLGKDTYHTYHTYHTYPSSKTQATECRLCKASSSRHFDTSRRLTTVVSTSFLVVRCIYDLPLKAFMTPSFSAA